MHHGTPIRRVGAAGRRAAVVVVGVAAVERLVDRDGPFDIALAFQFAGLQQQQARGAVIGLKGGG